MARYRLRFSLQEFDLPPGDTLIGRGPDCRITLVDPLVSRHHAKVRIEGSKATLTDLNSRNGSRVNGRLIRAVQALADGDRLRIGTQELVFSEVPSVQLAAHRTGFLSHCANCKLPYPEELTACPSCGSSHVEEDNTLSGVLDDQGRLNWALQMLIDMLRIERVKAHRVAIWDTIVACERAGSLDAAIRNAERGEIRRVGRIARDLRAVCFNGKTAARARPAWAEAGYETLVMPSTSPAYTLPIAEKLAQWQALAGVLAKR